MPLRVPPPEIPVVTFLSPNKADQGLIEFWNTEVASYVALDIGAPHPNTRQYPNFTLGSQRPVQGDEKWYIRTWITPETSSDWFNYALKFSGEGDSFPIFIRTYRELKSAYQPRVKGSALGTLYRLVMDNVGSGYSNGALPPVKFDDPVVPPTAVAEAHGVAGADGSIRECVVDFGGDGYTENVAFTVESPLNGIPASGISYIQPVTAILVREDASLFPEDSPFYAQYLQVVRVYETLPGPPLVSTVFDRDGVKKVVTERRVQVGTEVTDEAVAAGVLTRHFYTKIDTVVSNQITEVITVDSDSLLDLPELTTSIRNVIPEIFLAQIPLHVESHIIAGTAAEPALVLGEFEHSERQLHPLYKEVRSTILDNIGNLPITISGIKETNADKQVVSISMTLELDSTPATLPDEFTDVDYKKLGNGMAIETRRTIPDVFGNQVSETSITDPIPPEFRALFPTFTNAITAAGTITVPPPLGTGELSRREEQLTEFTFRRTTAAHDATGLPVTHISHELTAEFGGTILAVAATLNDSDMSVDEGLMVISSEVKNLGNGLFLKITRAADTDTEWPELLATHIDEKYLLEIDIKKRVVAAGTVGGVDLDGTIREVRSIDKWRSIQIASKFNADTLPEPVTWFSGQRHSFPPELLNAVIDWAEAVCGCSSSFSAALIANLSQYTGFVRSRITEQFYNDVPPDDVTITQFCPQTHHFGFAWASACGDADGNCRTKSGAPEFHIPLCLHGDLSLSIGTNVWTFPATSPPVLPHGEYIMLAPHVERWRFGVFRRTLTEVFVPLCEGGSRVFKADASSADADRK